MAQPTQELPPWLSFETTTRTNANGAPLTTETTLVYLPLTYFGPSIPLGSLWTFGGSTSPASTSTPSPTATAPTSTTLSPPTASPATSSTSATPSSSSSSSPTSSTSVIPSTSLSSSPTSSTLSPTSSSSTIPAATPPTSSSSLAPSSLSTGGLSRGGLIGVIVGSAIAGLVLLAICAIILITNRSRRRQTHYWAEPRSGFEIMSPSTVWAGPQPGNEPASPGEGSPRHSGEEADPLIFRRRQEEMAMAGTAAAASIAAAGGAAAAGESPNNSKSSKGTDYGQELDEDKRRWFMRSTPPEERLGRPLTPEERQLTDAETILPLTGEGGNTDFGPRMPRRTAFPLSEGALAVYNHPSNPSMTPSLRADADSGEHPAVMSARRVRVEDLPSAAASSSSPQSSPTERTSPSSPSSPFSAFRRSWLVSKANEGLTNFRGSTAWGFLRKDPHPTPAEHTYSGLETSDLTDRDIEGGRAMLAPPGPSASQPRPRDSSVRLVGMTEAGHRPISSVSARSGRSGASGPSIYHDAVSTLPGTTSTRAGTPAQAGGSSSTRAGTPLLAPPRALTPDERNHMEMGYRNPQTGSHAQEPSGQASQMSSDPPTYDDPPPLSRSQSHANLSHTDAGTGTDALDLPPPRGVSPFASFNSLRDGSTISSSSSMGLKKHPFPPGLTFALPPKVWNGSTTSGLGGTDTIRTGTTFDVLEEEPPEPQAGWSNMSLVVGSGDRGLNIIGSGIGVHPTFTGKRTTFGMPRIAQSPDIVSEQGSLHSSSASSRRHLSPSGSAPSRRDGSGSSHSHSNESERSGRSLTHSNSLSNENRRRKNASPRSPTYSAFGGGISSRLGSPTRGEFSHEGQPLIHSQFASDSSGSGSGSKSGHSHRGARSDHDEVYSVRSDRDRATSPLLSQVPWAAGLDEGWIPR